MIINDQTLNKIKARLRGITARVMAWRPDFAFVQDDVFQQSFKQGGAIWGGVFAGLIIWMIFQTTPTYPPYMLEVAFPGAVQEQVSATSEPVPGAHAEKSEHVEQPTHAEKPAHGEKEPTKSEHASTALPPDKVSLPMPGLTAHDEKYGELPVVRKEDGLRPFDAYRHPFAAAQLKKPLVAIVMMDYGLSAQASKSILGVLPSGVNLLLSPAADKPNEWVQQAYDHGHEVWLQLAVEPDNYPLSDPGANALLTAASVEKNQASMLHQLGHAVGYVGAFSPTPSPYFASGGDADFAANAIFSRGLGLMVNSPASAAIVRNAALEAKAPFYMAQMITVDGPDDYLDAFHAAEVRAQEKGFAIILFYPLSFAQKKVIDWTGDLQAKGYALTPLSVIAERGKDLSP